MKVVVFCHSVWSDWNNGNAHFLRGVVAELLARGHRVRVYEPAQGWSRRHLIAAQGGAALEGVRSAFPWMDAVAAVVDGPDVERLTEGADLVLVHEWNDPRLVARVGRERERAGYRLLFHDTHHRSMTDPAAMARLELSHYDGVLAFGTVIRDVYLERGWAERAWTWHEAADTSMFRPLEPAGRRRDLVWIGNWGDGERSRELHEFLVQPVARLGLAADVHGVRYPVAALGALARAGIGYGGWLPNHHVPAVFSAHRVTVHVPRRAYAEALPGIPTIRPFEALACGIPLVSAPWDDCERLFTAGEDHLVAQNGGQMERHLRDVLHDAALARSLSENGLRTIAGRHTCAHRVDELLGICSELRMDVRVEPAVRGDRTELARA